MEVGAWLFVINMHIHASRLMFLYLKQDTHLLLTGGMEKILRIFDLNRPDAPPREVDRSPGSVRTVAWLHSDQTILSTCTDMGGVRYGCLFDTCLKLLLGGIYVACWIFFFGGCIFASFTFIPFNSQYESFDSFAKLYVIACYDIAGRFSHYLHLQVVQRNIIDSIVNRIS